MNRVRELRHRLMLTHRQLARVAGVSVRTVVSIESGRGCRMDTKRKILKALRLSFGARDEVWPDG